MSEQSEKAVRRPAEERYRTLFESMLNGLAYCRMLYEEGRPSDFIYLEVNPAFETLTGLKNVVGRKVSEVIPGIREVDPSLLETYGRVAQTGAPERFETYVSALKMWFAISVYSPHRDHFVAVFDVIDQRKRAEEALIESERHFRGLIEGAGDPIFLIDIRDNRIRNCNQQAIIAYGYSRDEFLRMRTSDIEVKLKPEEIDAIHAQLVAGALNAPIEGIHKRKDGSTFPVEIRLSLLTSTEPRLLVSIVRDITERRKAEQERAELLESERIARADAESANRAKDEFLAIVSHELRTPLTAIEGMVWLLDCEEMSPSEREESFATIQRNLRLEKQIIDDLLDISGLERHQLSIRKQVLDLGRLVAETVAGFQAAAQAKSVGLVCEPAADLMVEGDPQRLRQVFCNLISNSIKFTPEKGEVKLTMRQEEGRALTTIEDTGPGIPADFARRAFEPFSQAESAITRSHGGLGLGLTIVKRLVDLHGGSVWIDPRVAGRGAKFNVALRLSASRREAPAAASPDVSTKTPPSHARMLRGLRILFIDDNDETRNTIVPVLRHFGADVRSAASAEEGYAAFRKDPPDVLISDISMPGEDGLSLIKRIRALPRQEGGETPAAALTGYAAKEDRAQVLGAGFQMFVSKPINPPELAKTVLALARNKAAQA